MWRSLLALTAVAPLISAQEPKDWLAKNALAFRTAKPGQGCEDLAGLREMIGDETIIVSLGESTHGSKEIFQMKHRLVEYLVRSCFL